MRLIAVKEVWYDGRTRYLGDEFEASDMDARILTAVDIPGGPKARPAGKRIEPTPKSVVEARDMTAEEETQTDKPQRRRIYQRRDLTAEDK